VREYVAYDPKIIRGLDYYTGTVFEARDTTGCFPCHLRRRALCQFGGRR